MRRDIQKSLWTRVVVSVVLAVFTAGPVAAADAQCIDLAGELEVGGTASVDPGAPAWWFVESRADHVYRLDVGGDAGVLFELWTLDFDLAADCYVADQVWLSGELDETEFSELWTPPEVVSMALKVTPAAGASTPVTVTHTEIAGPPEDTVLIVPAAAHTVGVRNTVFRTDVVVYNPLGVPVTVRVVLVPTGGGAEQSAEVELAAGEAAVLDDVVGSLLGLSDAVGALRIEVPWNRKVYAVSRTYAVGDAGTVGQLIPAREWHWAGGGRGGAVRTLPHLTSSDRYRSNVGFVEIVGLDADLELVMRDPAGAVVGSRMITVPAFGHLQINDIFADLDVTGVEHASLEVVIRSFARVFVYASVIDNLSSDPTYIPGLVSGWSFPVLPDSRRALIVPAAAATPGRFGTSWHTDLRVVSMDAQSGPVEVEFHPGDGSTPVAGSFEIPGGGPLAIDDVVTRVGGEGSGWLVVRHPDSHLLATSRTYSVEQPDGKVGAGTHGQYLATDGGIDGFLEKGLILGLERSSNFRSNLGIVNPWDYAVGVDLRLYGPSGGLLGERTITVPGGVRRQINDVFGFFGAGSGRGCRLEFEAVQGPGGQNLFVHGSVVDNRSGDPSTLPAIRIP